LEANSYMEDGEMTMLFCNEEMTSTSSLSAHLHA
jgi:hypothetical protein